jgi:uncharacterized membrane protein YfcA
MVSFFWNLLIASALGLLAGMGVGGGSLLLLWLTQIAGISQAQARLINLLFFLPAALIATGFRRQKAAKTGHVVLPAILCGCIAAGTITILSDGWNVDLLKKLLGGLLILTGLREVFYRPRNAK